MRPPRYLRPLIGLAFVAMAGFVALAGAGCGTGTNGAPRGTTIGEGEAENWAKAFVSAQQAALENSARIRDYERYLATGFSPSSRDGLSDFDPHHIRDLVERMSQAGLTTRPNRIDVRVSDVSAGTSAESSVVRFDATVERLVRDDAGRETMTTVTYRLRATLVLVDSRWQVIELVVDDTGTVDEETKSAPDATSADKHQALVLNAYRRVQELVDTTSTEGEYAIYPTRYLTAAEAELLWADLRDHGARALLVAAELPGGVIYDPQPNPDGTMPPSPTTGTKTWGGRDAAQHLLWHDWSDAPSSTVAGMVLNVLAREELLRPRPQLHEAVTIDSDYRISELRISASPHVVLEFWNRHMDEVEAIQPKIDQLDKLTPTLGPMKPLSEGQ